LTALRRRPRAAALLRLAYRVAYRALQVWSTVARPDARGVKCVVVDADGRALFVRHTYGRRANWELPGGGVHRRETPEQAVRREAREELGVDEAVWDPAGAADGHWYGKREQLSVFVAPWPGGAPRLDPVEIADAAWFSLAAPPSPVGPSTRLALDVLRDAGAGAPPRRP
jgi:8-oxo-dGTP pyrophosphatase MutT (NUDIX family)